MARNVEWPEWWAWELDFNLDHLQERMLRRKFNETELREMLERASGLREDEEPGRWMIYTKHDGNPWAVVVEPQWTERVLLVITAYRVN